MNGKPFPPLDGGTFYGYTAEQWEAMIDALTKALLVTAARRKPMPYEAVTHAVGRPTRCYIGTGMYAFPRLLAEVSRRSYAERGVLLTAIIVSKHAGHPSGGFHSLARGVGASTAGDDTDAFWRAEVERVYAHAA